jgi:hypothetical protein
VSLEADYLLMGVRNGAAAEKVGGLAPSQLVARRSIALGDGAVLRLPRLTAVLPTPGSGPILEHVNRIADLV